MTLHPETQFTVLCDEYKIEDGCLYFLSNGKWREDEMTIIDLFKCEEVVGVNDCTDNDVKMLCLEWVADIIGFDLYSVGGEK